MNLSTSPVPARRDLLRCIALLCAALPMALGSAAAQDYPSRPVKLVVPFPPGGVSDVLGRALADQLARKLGQPFVVENKAGAGTAIGTESVARSSPDGYTLLLSSGALAILPSLRKVAFDPMKDFAPIAQIVSTPLVLAAHRDFPPSTVPELLSFLRTHPGKVNYGVAGIGVADHLAGELLKSQAGVTMTAVVYKGAAPALQDLLAGRIQLRIDAYSSLRPHVESGALKLLATASSERLAFLPNLPTVAEAGLPGFEVQPWYGLLAPAGTPAPVVGKLTQAVQQALADPGMREMIQKAGLLLQFKDQAGFRRQIQQDQEKFGDLIKRAGIRAE